jgi:1-acyl-sn-glycerol-3-phosphate acyltransferase
MYALRASFILTAFTLMTVPLMPVQIMLLRTNRRWARHFPHWYHRRVCRLLGIRIRLHGEVASDRPVLLVSNHVSWLDITVLSAVAPVSFVAKSEVATWPFVSWLAKLQRSVFIERERRGSVADTARTVTDRLRSGDHIVLFAEGTSSDGNRVLPFRTSLFAAAKPRGTEAEALQRGIAVQTLAIAYTHLHGLPLGRARRPSVAWYGDMDMASHAWSVFKQGPLDVGIRVGPPIDLADFADRKALARHSEACIRADVAALLSPRAEAAGAAKAPTPSGGRGGSAGLEEWGLGRTI